MGFSIPRLADQALLARRYGREPAVVARPGGYRCIYSRARIPLRPGRARPANTGWLRREVARTRTGSDALAAGHTGEHRDCSAGLSGAIIARTYCRLKLIMPNGTKNVCLASDRSPWVRRAANLAV